MTDRCVWTGADAQMIEYHDREWGVPLHEERTLFEFLVLEGAQAGLSWTTILRKRENYRAAFDGFDFEKVARYGDDDTARLLADAGTTSYVPPKSGRGPRNLKRGWRSVSIHFSPVLTPCRMSTFGGSRIGRIANASGKDYAKRICPSPARLRRSRPSRLRVRRR